MSILGTVQTVLGERPFPDITLYHDPRSTTDTLQSFKQKSERLQKLLHETAHQGIFIYYHQYNEPVNGRHAEKNDYSIQEKLVLINRE